MGRILGKLGGIVVKTIWNGGGTFLLFRCFEWWFWLFAEFVTIKKWRWQ
jgi:hypothetical protein